MASRTIEVVIVNVAQHAPSGEDSVLALAMAPAVDIDHVWSTFLESSCELTSPGRLAAAELEAVARGKWGR